MAKNKLLGKVVAVRLYLKAWMLTINGQWTFADVLALGHRIVQVVITSPNCLTSTRMDPDNVTIGTRTCQFTILRRGGSQFSNVPPFVINDSADFDDIYPVLNKYKPKLVNKNKPIIIKTLITERNGKIFRWERHNVGVKGRPAWKLILMSVNGQDAGAKTLVWQKRVAGPIFEDKCEIREAFEEMNSCKLALGLDK